MEKICANEIKLTGRLGRDPEIRYTASGKSVTTFSLAVNGERRDKNGEWTTDWFNCKAWNDIGIGICENCRKGDKIMVTGRMINDAYEKDGHKRDNWIVNIGGAEKIAPIQEMEREPQDCPF